MYRILSALLVTFTMSLSPTLLSAQTAGWPEVFNPFHVVTLHFELDPAIWEDIKRDTNYYDPVLNIRVPCLMWADGETNKLEVQIRRKADPAMPSEEDPQKVSLKIDINEYVTGQEWRGLKKLSPESGAGGNGVVREGLAMNLHRLAAEHGFYDYEAGYGAWVRVVVNGNYVGLYSSPEQRDKQFLRNRGLYQPGAVWLYEINAGTFLDTTVATTNSPTYDFLCFSPFRTACSQPAIPTVALALETNLQAWVDMPGMLTLAAIESFVANNDGLFTKNGKNSFAVDYLPSLQRKRQYYPWDLDAGFTDTTLNIYTGGPGPLANRPYQTQILAHYWFRDQYRHIFSDLLDGPLHPATLTDFLNQLEPVLTPYLLEDPNSGGAPASQFASIRQYFTNRAANVRGQIGDLVGPPRFSRTGGEFVPGLELLLTHTNTAGTIYFTLNGTDPRAPGGSPMGAAYAEPIILTNTVHVMARVLHGTNWSALRQRTFNVAGHANALKVTEIMYAPTASSTNDDAGDFEFIELKNTGAADLDLSGCYFTGIGFRFMPGTTVPPGRFVVLVKNPVAFSARYPGVAFHGVYAGGLARAGEKIRLRNSDGNNVFSIEYNNQPPWPLGADGLGYSLVNMNLDGDPDNPENWRASTAVHGSPGADDPSPPYTVGVVVNEVIAHTDTPLEDAIELYNPTTSAIDISGWYLSDKNDPADSTRAQLKKYRFPAGTTLHAGGCKVLYEADFNPATANGNALIKFALSQYGEGAYLSSADSQGELTGHIVGLEFGASDNGVAVGRHQTSVGVDFTFLRHHTFGVTNPASKAEFRLGTGMTNAPPRVGPVVISEIMYHPAAGGNEFVELQNLTGTNVDLSGWTLKGAAFSFPPNTVIEPFSVLVLLGTTNISTGQFRASNQVPASVPILAHSFTLQNDGEALELRKPNDSPANPAIVVDRVRYNDQSPWPTEADGHGPSLERFPVSAYGNDPVNWRTVTPGGSPGRAGDFSSVIAIQRNSSWKYHALGHDLGAPSRAPSYSDSGWPGGKGNLGYGQPFITTLLTHAPGLSSRPVTTYFRKRFVINDPPAAVTNLILRVNYNDGFVAYLNGQEVVRRGLPEGEVFFNTLAALHNGGNYEAINLSEHADKLMRGGNVLTVEVHQSAPDDPDLIWDAELTHGAPPVVSHEPITIAAIRFEAGTGLVLEWNAVAGRLYRVQRSDNLNFWTDLDPLITADGSTGNFTDATPPSAAPWFYRVFLVE
jgi:hypothetical protein